MNYLDFIIFPFYVIIPIILVLNYSVKYIQDPILKKFFYRGFLLKIFGAICAVIIYVYYYNGGDTVEYYKNGSGLIDYIFDNPSNIIEVMTSNDLQNFSDYAFIPYKQALHYCYNKSSYILVKISFILGLLCFKSFLIESILCSYFSFFVSWKFYKFLIGLHPSLKTPFGYAIFYVPSVIFWGSGLFKDTFTLGGIQLFVIGIISLFQKGKSKGKNLLGMSLGLYLLIMIRSFYIITVMPFIVIWIFWFFTLTWWGKNTEICVISHHIINYNFYNLR